MPQVPNLYAYLNGMRTTQKSIQKASIEVTDADNSMMIKDDEEPANYREQYRSENNV